MWYRSEVCSDESANLNMVYNKLKFSRSFKLKGRLFPSWEFLYLTPSQAAVGQESEPAAY